ncbi:MAG: S41 family peptidase [Spirochaetales bacterium]|nr:S41 family peptidase [Spirochaetales bacterium]
MKKNLTFATIIMSVMCIFAALVITPSVMAQDNEGLEELKYKQMFEYIYKFVESYYVDEVSAEQLYEGAMKGLLQSLNDPYSSYLTDEEQANLTDTTRGEYAGVGLFISKPDPGSYDKQNPGDKYPQYVKITAPIEEGPSFRAGLHSGDYITKIEGKSVVELTVDEVKNRLRGKEGTGVTFTVLRGSREFDITIIREIIEVPTVRYALIEGPRNIIANEKIGYIRIIQFTSHTADRIRDALQDLKSKGYTGLVIDVRGNPGGLLSSVVDVMDMFLSEGPIVITKSRIPGENAIFEAHSDKTIVDANIGVAVLTDRYSASASEILSGAFKDTGRGIIVGEKTYGKASVQQARAIGDAVFKLTVARYYTPNDINIDKVGVSPDFEVENMTISDENTELLNKLLDSRVIEDFVDKNKDPSEQQVKQFITKLIKDGYTFEERILRKMIMQEVYRYWDFPPIYDLDYDLVLLKAIEELKK